MVKRTRMRLLAALAGAAALLLPTTPALAHGRAPHHPAPYWCTGGTIPSGHYRTIVVSGTCSVAAGAVILVDGTITVRRGATFDAQSAPSTITIRHNVIGWAGSFVGLGCQPPSLTGNSAHECMTDPNGSSRITVRGSVFVTDAAIVMLNGITVGGNVVLRGGGSGIWSVKNNTIHRNLSVSDVTTEWLGVMFNRIGGTAVLRDITITDTHPGAPGVFIVRNTVKKNLVCYHLAPGVSGGFIPGSVNVVGGRALGQCAALV